MKKKIIKYIGNIVVAISLLFIIKRMYKYRQEVSSMWSKDVLLVIIVSSLAYGLIMIGSSVVYRFVVCVVSDSDISMKKTVNIYCKSNLYKYLPGNVMHLVGKNQLAEETSATHGQIAFCTFLDLLCSAIGAVFVSIILSGTFVIKWLGDKGISIVSLILLILVLLFIFMAFIFVIFRSEKMSSIKKHFKRVFCKRGIIVLLGVIAYYMITQTIGGFLFIWLLGSLTDISSMAALYYFVGVYVFSWLIGFITPGAPGGIGIRETMLNILLAGIIAPQVVIVATVFNRIITTMGDIIAFLVSEVISIAPNMD